MSSEQDFREVIRLHNRIKKLEYQNKKMKKVLKKVYELSKYKKNHDEILYNFQSINRLVEPIIDKQ